MPKGIPKAKAPPEKKEPAFKKPPKELRSPFTAIEDVLNRKGTPVEQKKIAYQLMHFCGGEKGVAQMIMKEYESTQAGSLARARFFELLLKLVASVQQKELSGDLDYISEQDIANVLVEYCKASGVALGYPSHVCI